MTSDTAIDRIYSKYGETTPVSTIIKRLRDDNVNGRFESLVRDL